MCAVRGAATISLRVVPPVDDGGLPILGYVIIRQENWLGNYSEAVVALANHDRLDIIGLVPATGYRCVCLLSGQVVSCGSVRMWFLRRPLTGSEWRL